MCVCVCALLSQVFMSLRCLLDNEQPSITCPSDFQSTLTSSQLGLVYSYAPQTSDNSGVSSSVCDPPSGSTFAKGNTSVECMAADPSGNSKNCSFTVSVQGMASRMWLVSSVS